MKKLRIGVFVQRMAAPPEYKNNVSAHVQIPCKMAELLRERGHYVEMVTTAAEGAAVLPDCVPEEMEVHLVSYGKRQNGYIMYNGRKSGVSLSRLYRQLKELRGLAKENRYDIFHFCGGNGIGHLGGMLRLMGLRIPVVVTVSTGAFPERLAFLKNVLWRRVSAVITSTRYFAGKLLESRIPAQTINHGILKEMSGVRARVRSNSERRRILFWRDPDATNGADTCVEAFAELAPKYPAFSFEFAIRPHWDPVEGIDELAAQHPNVIIRRFPYENDETIEDFLADSACIVLPFRQLSINPQFAILESMACALPVVTTDIESNGEIIRSGENGFLVAPNSAKSVVEAVEKCIADLDEGDRIGALAATSLNDSWNWDGYAEAVEDVYSRVI